MSEPDERPLADRREHPEEHLDEDIGEEFAPSPTDPASLPEEEGQEEVYGQDEGYEKQTET
ncbi:hypothetical protein OUY22_02135 [Nonomuraea sp. MCN248]|uniref:Uncharacterized protein n=1 Tax=Nonomuraea corallina TaxID=2989783 RepID=A0ABT4S4Y4_9ACTN|nr:hypothetical protein [Nonomuraea corallina]MDA0632200.1 hypothetical protein [Nonomuraea corallina]